MTESRAAVIDAGVLFAIRDGIRTASGIEAVVWRRHLKMHGMSPDNFFRVIDRSLQRLRREGVIVYKGRKVGWCEINPDVPPEMQIAAIEVVLERWKRELSCSVQLFDTVAVGQQNWLRKRYHEIYQALHGRLE